MRIALALVGASVALLVGTADASAATPSEISGTVIKGPTAPVRREGVPCSAPAAAIAFFRNGVRVASTTTSKAGTYRI